ncbi:MAG: single-stranded-DNA-specific exonuclease RecJ [Saprospiraceae bacterium]|nr:single-stranded-DNA-specific exonuclease RecJ [Saprospiraceae bacterium]MDW8483838.1 single-stranded-DNA-specific exonuclease RecJ [Saprospiraceae bacterium]
MGVVEPRWRLIETDEGVVERLRQMLGIHPALCRILAQRGIHTFDDAKRFFRPSLSHLHSPFQLRDMERAVERVLRAVRNGERILLYGDYDADGITGVALLYAFLSRFHPLLDYYLPDREREGYGISLAGIEYACQTNTSLLITVDCGTHAHRPIALAKEYGIDVIVCDHHLPEEEGWPPAYATLNPKRPDCPYPNKHLSGCGVAFKLAQGLCQARNAAPEEWEDLLDLVALSTCCDLVALVGENRTLTHFGLERLGHQARIGVWALVQKSGCSPPLKVRDVVFGLGPLVNAAGRMGDARDAVRLLLSNDRRNALQQAAVLVAKNRRRQQIERTATARAIRQLTQQRGFKQRKSIVWFESSLPRGIAGIVASRLAEHFHRPTLVLTQSGEMATGSGRSVPGFDLYAALKHCQHLLTSFGGHTHAAGMELAVTQVPALIEQFEAVVQERLPPEAEQPEIPLCSVLELADVTPAFWRTLKQFAPFGPGNMTPIFLARGVRDSGYSRCLHSGHVQFSVRQGDGPIFTGVGYNMAKHFQQIRHEPFDLAFSLQEDMFQGTASLCLRARALRPASRELPDE